MVGSICQGKGISQEDKAGLRCALSQAFFFSLERISRNHRGPGAGGEWSGRAKKRVIFNNLAGSTKGWVDMHRYTQSWT